MKAQELLELKQVIEEAKDRTLQLKGQKDALFQQLKDEFNCTTLQQAEKELKKLETEIANLSTEIENGLQVIEEQYEKITENGTE